MTATIALALVLGAPALKDKAKPAPLEGTWQVLSMSAGGAVTAPDKDEWHFSTDGKVTVSTGGETHNLTYSKEAGETFKNLDLVQTERGLRLFVKCIYQIAGDELTLVGGTADDRPTSMVSGPKVTVWVMKRVKAAR